MSENTDNLYYDDDELFDMFDSEYTKEVILSLYEDGTLEKFGIKNLGYNKYKDNTFELLEDIIYLSNDLGYGSYAVQLLRENHEKLFSYKINLESFNLKARRTEHLYQLMPKICAIAGCFVR